MFYRYEHYMFISHVALIVNMIHFSVCGYSFGFGLFLRSVDLKFTGNLQENTFYYLLFRVCIYTYICMFVSIHLRV